MYSAEYKLQRVSALVYAEAAKDQELFNKMDAGEITMDEYKAQSPRYNSELPKLMKELGIEE